MNKGLHYLLTLAVGFAFVAGHSTNATAEEFYKGKTIRFVVGYSPGGGYDTYTRAAARHISKYIPGNPTPIVQNMTGGGSLIAANYIYNRAKPDGLTVGIWNGGLVLQQALGERKVKFKGDKFGWIGAPVKGFPTCAIMGFTGLKTLNDVLKSGKPIKMGATRAGSTTDDLPKILNKTLGTNFKVISGYRGTAIIRIAMQKREVDGACWGWESMVVTARSMLDAKGDDRLIPFLTYGNPKEPEVKDLPQITDVIKGEDNLATFRAWVTSYEFQRPLTLPPGTPKDRLQILRKAYKATLADPKFLAEARKSKLIINYVSGEEIEKHVATILATPPKAKESLQFLVRKKKKKS
ncbi:MAG: Bug family tripartite tricarboxylate transporter substrate binding protein [Candidatus Binatia bacterium]